MLTIGELAKRLGIRPSTLRYYEAQDLLQPSERSAAGYRLYDPAAEQVVRFIQKAHRLGFTLADIRVLLEERQRGETVDTDTIFAIAETRYLTLERQITELLVLQHELGLFMRDMVQQPATPRTAQSEPSPLDRLIDRVCANPLNQPVGAMLNQLMESTGCQLTSAKGKTLLNQLRGQHVHIWQVEEAYHILVISTDPAIGTALRSLTHLEANCQIDTHANHAPQLFDDQEGYLFVAGGPHAFLFARLFLSLEEESSSDL